MSSFESDDAAAEALYAANVGEVTPPGDVPQVEQVPATTEDTTVGQSATDTDTLQSIDLSHLTPEARELAETAIKQMQGDYTRKTQEVAPYRKAMEASGMDAETAREALEFVQALNDPANLQALYTRLDAEFGTTSDADTWGDDGVVEVDPRDQLLSQVQGRLDAMEHRAMEVEVRADLDRQEAIIRTENPSWGDEDLNTIAQLAIPLQGDLVRAAEGYKALQNRILSAHLQGKAQVSAGVTGIAGTTHAETPTKFEGLDEAHAAALRDFAEELAN